MQFGVFSFVDNTVDASTGKKLHPAQRLGNFGYQRFNMQMSVGSMPHEKVMRSIELFGTEVVPAVKKALTAQAEK